MKKLNIDIFKLFISFAIILALFIFYQHSQNGRYQCDKDYQVIFDTQTGKMYPLSNAAKKYIESNNVAQNISAVGKDIWQIINMISFLILIILLVWSINKNKTHRHNNL